MVTVGYTVTMRKIRGGAAIPVYVVPLTELKENGGIRKVQGGASWAVFAYTDNGDTPPDNALLVGGGNWLAVNPVDWLGV